jgi:glyoxylase-like metal-dependent hydrolase (beta-lactamase superfamily II)
MARRTVGRLEVVALTDARGPFLAWHDAFPDASAAEWALARELDPAAFGDGGRWWLDFRCFLILGDRVTLVDTGVGPSNSPAATWAPVPGSLPDRLAEVGVSLEDVDTVVLTHLHTDHCGWAVRDGVPAFPNARYVLQRAEVLAVTDPLASYAVAPLRVAGQLDEVDGEVVLSRAPTGETVTVTPTPGHTPGHQSVVVDGDGTQVVVTGDALVHAVQLVAPGVAYVYEEDQRQARETREALLARTAAAHGYLATPHLTEPFLPATPPDPTHL